MASHEKRRSVQVEIKRHLQCYQEKTSLQPRQIRVLDYGCGSGEAVLDLKNLGYDVYGVDVDETAILSGRKLLSLNHLDGEKILTAYRAGGVLPFPDGFFHFVFSQEVIEHVGDLSAMAGEIQRVTVPSGMGFHIFRPQFNVVEPHFGMPLVHWLPKNGLRRWAILLFAYLGLGMRPPEIPGAGPRQRGEFLYKYSVERTFYRPYRQINEVFRRYGFDVCCTALNHRKLQSIPLLPGFLDQVFIRAWIEGLIVTFHTSYILTRISDGEVDPEISMGKWTGKFLPALSNRQ